MNRCCRLIFVIFLIFLISPVKYSDSEVESVLEL